MRGRTTKSSVSDAADVAEANKRIPRGGGLATRHTNTQVNEVAGNPEPQGQKAVIRRGTLIDQKNIVAANKNSKVLQTKQEAKKQREAEVAISSKKVEKREEPVTLSGSRFDDVVLHCDTYEKDIYDYMFIAENRFGVQADFLADRAVTPKMRSILVDWLLQVHLRFHLLPETLFSTFNLLDRYLAVGDADKTNLQLVGITCLSIASKFEEIYAPELQDYVYIAEESFSKRDIIRMEVGILSKVGVDLGRPHVIQFLRRITCYFDAVLHAMAKYISENAVCDYATCHLKPSFIAAVSLWLAGLLEERELPDNVFDIARVSAEQVREWGAVFAASLLKTHNNTKLFALRSKYATPKNSRVSDLLPNQVAILQKIARRCC
ncbi:G2/mitotic-specific cyclin-B [Toxocara canis]|uniref:G2/mitotic-specific cyclin-B n=1 Tax=Toxocara canis TaxID=6265 RepID=A0A0B2VJZ1_TOXCA|nr:G2/mitotic-specific cyclin-B [Toxocara canis]